MADESESKIIFKKAQTLSVEVKDIPSVDLQCIEVSIQRLILRAHAVEK